MLQAIYAVNPESVSQVTDPATGEPLPSLINEVTVADIRSGIIDPGSATSMT